MNFYTSDIHFGDTPTFEEMLRPFKSVRDFDKFMIKQINKQAKAGDTIYVIGDMVDCDGPEFEQWRKTIYYVKKIKAQVVLIIGNNEDKIVKYFFKNNFNKFKQFCLDIGYKDVKKSAYTIIGNTKFYMVHKPSQCKKDMMNLFGHVHNAGGLYYPFGINVGCDLNYLRLYSEKDIEHIIKDRWPYWVNDPEQIVNLKK